MMPADGEKLEWSEETIARITAALAAQVGPVAQVLVDRELKKVNTLDDLVDNLVENIAGVGPRREFRQAMKNLT